MAVAKKKTDKKAKPEKKVSKVQAKKVEKKQQDTEEVKVVKPAKTEKKVSIETPTLQQLLDAGAHFGHSVKRRNPRMDDYIYAVKNGVQIFDLVKTKEQLDKAVVYIEEVVAKGGQVLVLGTKGQAAEIVRQESVRVGNPYIINRWVGGLFTNWDELKKRIDLLSEMKVKMEAGDYKKYTKKEQVIIKRDIDRLERMYGGLVTLNKLPDVLFIVDPTREDTALREAVAKQIPVVAVCDSNCDPTNILHVIPANDDAVKTVELLVKTVISAIEHGYKAQKRSQK